MSSLCPTHNLPIPYKEQWFIAFVLIDSGGTVESSLKRNALFSIKRKGPQPFFRTCDYWKDLYCKVGLSYPLRTKSKVLNYSKLPPAPKTRPSLKISIREALKSSILALYSGIICSKKLSRPTENILRR